MALTTTAYGTTARRLMTDIASASSSTQMNRNTNTKPAIARSGCRPDSATWLAAMQNRISGTGRLTQRVRVWQAR